MAERDRDCILDGLVMSGDAFFGSKTEGKKRGRETEKQNMLILVSVTKDLKPRFAKIRTVPNMKNATVSGAMDEMAKRENHLISGGHRTLINHFTHQVQVITKDPNKALDMFKPIHRIISNAKAVIRNTSHGVSNKHRQDEYCYWLNRRFREHFIFGKLVSACVLAKPITYAELTS